jgi:hypothetical protein
MQIHLEREELKSVVAEVVTEMVDRFGDDDQIAYTEEQAAGKLGIAKHVLRDERLKGRIKPGKSGRNWLYSRKMLLEYVEQNQATTDA